MELRRYLSIARRRALLILAIVGAALAAGYLITPREKTYTATSTLYVGSRSIDIDPRSGQVSQDHALGLDRLIKTFQEMIRSEPVASGAVRRTEVDRSVGEVVGGTSAAQVTGTNLILVSMTDRDPAAAAALSNAVSASFVNEIRSFEPRDQNDTADQVVSVYQNAGVPGVPNSSGLARNLVLAGLFGIIVAGAVVALLEHLDISLRSSDDVERHLELVVLGVVPALGDHLPTPPAARIEGLEHIERATTRQGSPVG